MTDQLRRKRRQALTAPKLWYGRLVSVILAVLLHRSVLCGDTLTLDQAVSTALSNNRSIQNSVLDAQKAQDRLAANRTKQFPGISVYTLAAQQLKTFEFTLEEGVLGNYQGIGPLPSEDVHLETPLQPTGLTLARVSQPLSSLIRIRRNLDTLKTGVAISEEQTRAERQKITREVKSVYYSLQQAQASLRSVRQTTELYQEVEKLTANYLVQEVALKGDLLESQVYLAKNLQQETMLKNQEASGKERLNQLLGRDILTDFEVQPVLEATGSEPTLEEARALALRNRPEIRQAALRQRQAEQDLRAKRAEYIPDLSAEFNSITLMNYGSFLPVQSMSVGVSLSWEPFDWGRKKKESAEKAHTVDQAQLAQKEAESSVLSDINDKHRQLRYWRAELSVARLTQENAIENLRVVKNKYAVQTVLVKHVLQAQVALEQSSSEYQQALTSFWNARAEFERALGEDR